MTLGGGEGHIVLFSLKRRTFRLLLRIFEMSSWIEILAGMRKQIESNNQEALSDLCADLINTRGYYAMCALIRHIKKVWVNLSPEMKTCLKGILIRLPSQKGITPNALGIQEDCDIYMLTSQVRVYMKFGQLLMDWYKDLKKTFENLNTFFRMMVQIHIPWILELFEKVYRIWEKDVEDIPAKFRELTRKREQKRRPSKEKKENRITKLKKKLEGEEITPKQKRMLIRELRSLETKKTCEKQKKKGSRIPCDERKKSVRMPYTEKTRDIIQTSITWLNEFTYFLWEIESELGINCNFKTSFQDDILETFSKFEALTYLTFKKID